MFYDIHIQSPQQLWLMKCGAGTVGRRNIGEGYFIFVSCWCGEREATMTHNGKNSVPFKIHMETEKIKPAVILCLCYGCQFYSVYSFHKPLPCLLLNLLKSNHEKFNRNLVAVNAFYTK